MELDIARWEMNRTHWAVKDVDLPEILRNAGVLTADREAADLTPPVPQQAKLVVAPGVFRVPKEIQDSGLVALMMPFSAEFNSVAEKVRQACAEIGLTCQRADDEWQESTIIQQIFNLIYRCSAVIADLSGGNSNVMYEIGIAHTLGRPVVPILQHGSRLPFDLSHHRALFYHNNREGLETMKAALEERLRYVFPDR